MKTTITTEPSAPDEPAQKPARDRGKTIIKESWRVSGTILGTVIIFLLAAFFMLTLKRMSDATVLNSKTIAESIGITHEAIKRLDEKVDKLQRVVVSQGDLIRADISEQASLDRETTHGFVKAVTDGFITTGKLIGEEGAKTRAAVSDEAKQSRDTADKALADMNRELQEKLERPPETDQPTTVASQSGPTVRASNGATHVSSSSEYITDLDSGRRRQDLPFGGRSRVFTRDDINTAQVLVSPTPGIHATLLFKTGWVRSFTRDKEINPGEPFDIQNADQVIFWSDKPFWVSWKK